MVLGDFRAISLSISYVHFFVQIFIWWKLLPKRNDDEDDEMAVIEQDVQRLVIVTQVLLFII